MASLCHIPYPLLPSLPRAPRSVPSWRLLCILSRRRSVVRGGSIVARLGPSGFSDFEVAEEWARQLLGRAEGFAYTIADAAVNSYPDASATAGTAAAASEVTKQRDWLSGITDYMEFVLKVESALAMKSLQPQVKAIQERYAGDQERIQLETARLYKLADVNPLAGLSKEISIIRKASFT